MVTHYNPPLSHDRPHMRAMQAFEQSAFKYGDEVSYEWLEQALGIKYQGKSKTIDAKENREWMAELKKFRDMVLTEHSMCLATSSKKGLVIVEPTEQTKWSEAEFRREFHKLCKKTAQRLVHIDTSKLDAEQIRQNQHAIARLAFLRQNSRKNKIDALMGLDK